MEMRFYGAAGGVTGSCHFLAAAGKNILIDCGMFQGEHNIDEENRAEFGFDASSIDVLFLTHAHLDHCGRIPLLVKRGFRGEIITTAATRELTRLVLLDAAGLAAEEARHAGRYRQRQGAEPLEPLYEITDVLESMDRFGRVAGYGETLTVAPGVMATFGDAGHILGSAWILIEAREGNQSRRILYSGDLGNRGKPIINAPAPAPKADVVVMETTYGDRLHKAIGPSIEELGEAVRTTLDGNGNAIIPTFALERAQDLLYYLREMTEKRTLPVSLPVFLDSPMAISATKIFRGHPECFNAETRHEFADGHDPFWLRNLHFTRETSESIALNQIQSGAVIMAGSGMATGGRIKHHLRHNLWRPDSSVIFVGYAAQGTLARRIIDGAKKVRLFGEEVTVRARIYTIGGFSAHADHDELLAWYGAQRPEHTFLVHGEDNGRQGIAKILEGRGLAVRMPLMGDRFPL